MVHGVGGGWEGLCLVPLPQPCLMDLGPEPPHTPPRQSRCGQQSYRPPKLSTPRPPRTCEYVKGRNSAGVMKLRISRWGPSVIPGVFRRASEAQGSE